MKFPSSRIALAASLLGASACSTQAASAVAGDGHGGYGFSFGPGELRHREHAALDNCRERSSHPDDARILSSTEERGAGAVVRFYAGDGTEHVACALARPNPERARQDAIREARHLGAVRFEVIREWVDS